ncbi:MAG: ParB N-terminal domain-containing protein [Nitrosospira sp.]
MLCAFPIHFVLVKQIRPNECHYPNRAMVLADAILREQLWRMPIALERTSLAVMDGHHRLQAACQLRLKYVPCLLLDYDYVKVDATRRGYRVNPHEIVRRARAGDLYPPKTTRHRFPSPLPICNISVPLLQDQTTSPSSSVSPCSLNRYVARMMEAANERGTAPGYGKAS